jgi:cell division protein FtsN
MESKQRLFIYDRKEMIVLVLLGLMVAVFAFTLGVHLGKKVGGAAPVARSGDVPPLATAPDNVPNRQELTEQGKVANQVAEETLQKSLHDEVGRTGIKLETQRQVDLPEKPRAKSGGATTTRPKPQAEAPAPENRTAGSEPAPAADGKYTLQVGSHHEVGDARRQMSTLEESGVKPIMRSAELKGRGTWYRIYLGGFDTKEAAEKAGLEFKSRKVIDSFIIAKRPE